MAFYRKYRPKDFSEVIGQEHVTTTLQNAIKAGTVSHAYLFCGPRGSGKTTLARIFAKTINCQKIKGTEPCNACASCVDITAGKSIDIIEIDAASNRSIDDVRALKEGIRFAPVSSKYKVFIIDECHQLSKDAANALLKTLEEPPSHAIFLLATTEANKMIPTIVSRCQRFDFKKLAISQIVEKLTFIAKKESITFDEKSLALIAFHARGSFRDAESLLEKCINFTGNQSSVSADQVKELLGLVEVTQIAGFVDYIIAKDTKGAITYITTLFENSVDLHEFTKSLVHYLHQALLLKIDPTMITAQKSGMATEEIEKIKEQVKLVSLEDITKMTESCMDAEAKMKYANIIQLPLELAVVSMTTQTNV